MKKRFSEEQIIWILREAEVNGAVIRDVCRKHNLSEQPFFAGVINTAACPSPTHAG